MSSRSAWVIHLLVFFLISVLTVSAVPGTGGDSDKLALLGCQSYGDKFFWLKWQTVTEKEKKKGYHMPATKKECLWLLFLSSHMATSKTIHTLNKFACRRYAKEGHCFLPVAHLVFSSHSCMFLSCHRPTQSISFKDI